MKKYLLLLLTITSAMIFTACSSDDDGGYKNKELSSIQLKFHFTPFKSSEYKDSKKLYTKEVYLFNLEGKKVKDPITPYATNVKKYGNVCVIDDVNNEYIFADYSGDFVQLKDNSGYYTFDCISAIYNYNFYGKENLKRGEHLLVIKVDGTYFCKKLSINPQGDNVAYEFNLIQTGKDETANKFVWF